MVDIAGRLIGRNQSPFVIAEISGNHNQSLDRALEIVDAAAASGAHAVKIQTYTADTMTIDFDDGPFLIDDPDSLWSGKTLHNLYKEAHTPWEWHKPIFDRARSKGIICFSSAFDKTSVDFLESLDVPCYKIASFENTDLPLIKYVAATRKPLIISTGMATMAEIDDAVRTAQGAGCKELLLLQCTSSYPASPNDSNLLRIPLLRELFGVEVGLSDHTLGIGVPVASVALGATVIEKHITLSRKDEGVDSAFSLEPQEFLELVNETDRARLALGSGTYDPRAGVESKSLRFRRSLFVVEDIEPGEELTATNVRAIRPGTGLPAKYISEFLGMKVTRRIQRGTPLSWKLLRSI
ncbi:MAG: pseudaminic acid synthase [Hyphomicrobiaceae bacterium]